MSETIQSPKNEAAETSHQKHGRVFEFLHSVPGLLTAIAATITAIGGLYVALKPHPKAEPAEKYVATVSTPTPTPNGKEMRLKRGERTRVNDDVEIELVNIQTLKGKSGKDESSTQQFNKSLEDSEHVYSKILNEAGVANQTAETIRGMTQAQWDGFLDSLSENEKETITHTPFARFCVFVDGKKKDAFRRTKFFEGEALDLSDQKLHVVVLSILNTKRIEKGSVDVRLVK